MARKVTVGQPMPQSRRRSMVPHTTIRESAAVERLHHQVNRACSAVHRVQTER